MPPKKRTFSSDELEALLVLLNSPVKSQITAPRKAAPAVAGVKTTRRGADTRETKAQYDARIKRTGLGKSTGSSKKKGGDESNFQRVMDVLSRGNYASAEAFRRAVDPNDNDKGWNFTEAAKGFGSGLAGKSKTHFNDVLKQQGNAKGHEGKVGFLLDVFADPLTYTGIGLVSKVGKAVEGAEAVSKGARAAAAAERAKPDVVQLGELLFKGGAKVARKAAGKTTRGETLNASAARAAYRASVPTAATVAKPALSNSNNTAPKAAAEALERFDEAVVPAPTPVAKKTQPKPKVPTQKELEIEARATADKAYDKAFGGGGDSLVDIREAAALGHPKYLEMLKTVEADSNYQTMYKRALDKKQAGVAKILAATNEAPEVLQAADARVVKSTELVDPRDMPRVQARVDEALKIMQPGAKEFENLAKPGSIGAKQGPHTGFAPEKQVNLFSKIATDIKNRRIHGKNPDGTPRTAEGLREDAQHFQILKDAYRHAENEIEAAGKLPRASRNDATPLRLSAILDRLEPADVFGKGKPTLTQIMKRQTGIAKYDEIYDSAMAGAKLQDAAQAAAPAVAITDLIRATDNMPTSAAADVLRTAPEAVDAAMRATGTSKDTRKLIRDITRAARTEKMSPLDIAYEKTALQVTVAKGAKSTPVARTPDPSKPLIEHAIAADKILGVYVGPFPMIKWNASKTNRFLRDDTTTARMMEMWDRGADSIMLRLSTSRGRVDAAGAVGNMGKALQVGKAIEVNRVSAYSVDSAKSIDSALGPQSGLAEADRLDLFAAAQRGEDNFVTQRIAAQEEIVRMHGIRADDIAFELRRMGAKDNVFYPKPDSGLESWKKANLSSDALARDLYLYENAVLKAQSDYTIFSDFATKFGSATPVAGYVKVDGIHAGVNGLYFRSEDVGYLTDFKRIADFAAGNKKAVPAAMWQKYDKIMNIWKFMATRMNPQYYVRNGIGEVYINSLDNVGIKHYNMSRKMLAARKQVPENAPDIMSLQGVNPTAVAFTHPKWGKVTYDMVWRAFNDGGARQVFAVSDNQMDLGMPTPSRIPGAQTLEKFGDYEETLLRAAHFIKVLQESKVDDIGMAAREAGARVNRHHGNYGESTEFERKFLRRAVPFYTWQKKVIPVLLETALMNPGKTMIYPKLQYAIAQEFQSEPGQMTGTLFPRPDELMPSWMREGAAVPYGISPAGNTIMGDPGTPFSDSLRENVNHPKENILGQLAPALKIPLELSRTDDDAPNGRQYFGGGIPIQDKSDYLAGQVPLLSTLTRITRQGPLASENMGEDEQGTNKLALINWLTAARLQENTERRKRGAGIEEKQKARRKAREEAKKKENR